MNEQFKKLVKTIESKVSQEICDNVYGYTSVFSSVPVKLVAVSKDASTVY